MFASVVPGPGSSGRMRVRSRAGGDVHHRAVVALAGPAAEARWQFGSSRLAMDEVFTAHSSHDHQDAREAVRRSGCCRPLMASCAPRGVSSRANPTAVQRYLANAFGDHLDEARTAMKELAGRYEPAELNRIGFPAV
jgi:hypothetical protein